MADTGTMWPATLFLLILVSLAIASEDTGDCVMSEWSAWGPCITGEQEGVKDEGAEGTYDEEASDGQDIGRDMMHVLTAMKVNHRSWAAQCQDADTCPELNPRPSHTEQPVECVDGMSGDYPCHLVDMMSFVDLTDLGYTQEHADELGDFLRWGNDIWGWTDPLTGSEYALMGTSGGTSFVDVTDPLRPRVLAFLMTRTTFSIWRDIKVFNNTAYIGSEATDHGIQVVDLLRLRDMTEFSYIESDYDYTLLGDSHNMVSDETTGYIYAVGSDQGHINNNRPGQWRAGNSSFLHCKGGLHIMDVRTDRLRPEFVGCYSDDSYTHDAQCVIYHGPHRRYQGRHICFNFNEDTLTIVDMTKPEFPRLISKTGYTGASYTHQGWLTEDHVTLLLDDELDENYTGTQTHTYIWDVTKLHKPRLRALFKSTEFAIDHNMYIHNGLVFQSNYGAGLRILHVNSENLDLHEVGYFDVLPTSQSTPVFEGTWSNYPYFPSGTVIVSSIEYGLFVLRPNYEQIWSDVEAHHEYYEQTRTRTILSAPPGAVCPSEVQPRQCTPEK